MNNNELYQQAGQEADELISKIRGYKETLLVTKEFREKEKNKGNKDDITRQVNALDEKIEQVEFLEEFPFFQKVYIKAGQKLMSSRVLSNSQNSEDFDLQVIYISKFGIPSLGIYSWVSPIGNLRFSNPGKAKYKLPSGETKEVEILKKEVFQFADGNIIFMSLVNEQGTALVHQEHFAKHEFALQEVVSKLEKFQDEIIKTSFNTPLLISGPAGSGKTTLGFHRLAYLHQDTSSSPVFDSVKSLALVSDESTKQYFYNILSTLNIHSKVTLRTFSGFARELLDLPSSVVVETSYDTLDPQNLLNCFYKTRVNQKEVNLKEGVSEAKVLSNLSEKKLLLSDSFDLKKLESEKDIFEYLKNIYSELPDSFQKNFDIQIKKKILDSYDIAHLLDQKNNYENGLYQKVPVNVVTKKFGGVTQLFDKKVSYAALLVDEFQNHTKLIHNLLRLCIHPETNSLIYVGDHNQKTRPGANTDEIVSDSTIHKIVIEKTYRNSSAILGYLAECGFAVPNSSGSTSVGLVKEYIGNKKVAEEVKIIMKELLETKQETTIGIICFEKELLHNLQNEFSPEKCRDGASSVFKKVMVLSATSAQGVEFEHCVVCIPETKKLDENEYPSEFISEYQTILKDSLYVALTRATDSLHVVTARSLKK